MTTTYLIKGNITIPYTIKSNTRTKRLRISINSDGEVTVTKPKRVSNTQIERIISDRFDWIQNTRQDMLKKPKKLLAHFSAKDYKENRIRALELAKIKVTHFNTFYNFNIKNILIKNQKTRWGSCSNKKNLSFNYKILFLPSELQDYITVHELCHLKEMNHSQRFWNEVAKTVPDYVDRRKKMRLY